jgi:hypothetical protein
MNYDKKARGGVAHFGIMTNTLGVQIARLNIFPFSQRLRVSRRATIAVTTG